MEQKSCNFVPYTYIQVLTSSSAQEQLMSVCWI